MKITYPHKTNHFTDQDFTFPKIENDKKYTKRRSIYVILTNNIGDIATIKYRKEIGSMFPLPGGGVKKNENWKEGIKRETIEEIACVIKNIKSIGSFDSYDINTTRLFQSIICTAELSGKLDKQDLQEDYEQGAKLVWLKKEKLLSKLKNNAGISRTLNTKDCRSFMTLKILGEI